MPAMDPSLGYTTVFEPNWSETAAPAEEFPDLGNVELDWCNSSVGGRRCQEILVIMPPMDPSLDYTTVFEPNPSEPNWSEIAAEEFWDLGNVELDWCNSGVSGDSNFMAPVLNAPVHPVVQDSNMSASDHLTQAMVLAEIDKELEQGAEKLRPKRRNVKVSTNPQSVIARIRREKIASQLRVLQTLVPGGTKMDTVSMLKQAITYAKLLQQTFAVTTPRECDKIL
ncbi:unnamed protein product [Calypogeia fissa]